MSRFKDWKKPKIEHNVPTKWNWVVAYPDEFVLGNEVDIGAFTYINAKGGVVIEDDVQIGGGCKIYSHNTIDDTKGPVVLKKGCKIGANCVILPGVVIGEYAVIGALSLVKTSIKPGTINYGIPTSFS